MGDNWNRPAIACLQGVRAGGLLGGSVAGDLLGPVCLSFSAAFQCEKAEAYTNSEFLAQFLESQKLRKADFIWEAEKPNFLSFLQPFASRKLKTSSKSYCWLK